jgi:hypothetical protein
VLAASQVTWEQDDRLHKQISELTKQVAELVKEMASNKSIQISDADSTVWKALKCSAGLKLEYVKTDLFDATKHKERHVFPFNWDDRGERTHSESYVSYINNLFELGWKWLVIDADKEKRLLDNDL